MAQIEKQRFIIDVKKYQLFDFFPYVNDENKEEVKTSCVSHK